LQQNVLVSRLNDSSFLVSRLNDSSFLQSLQVAYTELFILCPSACVA
jgi:hypothetical protein